MTVEADSEYLIDRTGNFTVATTDPNDFCIYMSETLRGDFRTRVLLHELAHAMMFSYGYVDVIHDMTYPQHWIDMEELIANLISDRAKEIFDRAYDIVGDEAIHFVPMYLERLA